MSLGLTDGLEPFGRQSARRVFRLAHGDLLGSCPGRAGHILSVRIGGARLVAAGRSAITVRHGRSKGVLRRHTRVEFFHRCAPVDPSRAGSRGEPLPARDRQEGLFLAARLLPGLGPDQEDGAASHGIMGGSRPPVRVRTVHRPPADEPNPGEGSDAPARAGSLSTAPLWMRRRQRCADDGPASRSPFRTAPAVLHLLLRRHPHGLVRGARALGPGDRSGLLVRELFPPVTALFVPGLPARRHSRDGVVHRRLRGPGRIQRGRPGRSSTP